MLKEYLKNFEVEYDIAQPFRHSITLSEECPDLIIPEGIIYDRISISGDDVTPIMEQLSKKILNNELKATFTFGRHLKEVTHNFCRNHLLHVAFHTTPTIYSKLENIISEHNLGHYSPNKCEYYILIFPILDLIAYEKARPLIQWLDISVGIAGLIPDLSMYSDDIEWLEEFNKDYSGRALEL